MLTAEQRVEILASAKPNSWVAFSSDESKVVAQGDTYEETVREAEKNGESDPLLVRIPDDWQPRVF